jgi:hypothetical protein
MTPCDSLLLVTPLLAVSSNSILDHRGKSRLKTSIDYVGHSDLGDHKFTLSCNADRLGHHASLVGITLDVFDLFDIEQFLDALVELVTLDLVAPDRQYAEFR